MAVTLAKPALVLPFSPPDTMTLPPAPMVVPVATAPDRTNVPPLPTLPAAPGAGAGAEPARAPAGADRPASGPAAAPGCAAAVDRRVDGAATVSDLQRHAVADDIAVQREVRNRAGWGKRVGADGERAAAG